jgi:hypothetical protein
MQGNPTGRHVARWRRRPRRRVLCTLPWFGTAAKLAQGDQLAVYPAIGWWRVADRSAGVSDERPATRCASLNLAGESPSR